MVDSLLTTMKYDANTMQVDRTWLGTCPTDQHVTDKLKIPIIIKQKKKKKLISVGSKGTATVP